MALKDIIDKRHDKKLCKDNAEENGRAFNHLPYHCYYHTNSPLYNDLLVKETLLDRNDIDGDNTLEKHEESMKLIQFAVYSKLGKIKKEVKNCGIQIDCTGE